jgi:hypothetical protein
MNKPKFLSVIFLAALFCYSCTKEEPGDGTVIDFITDNVLYANSFENEADTVGLSGYCFVSLEEDTPVGGGAYSLFVSCGCIAPHATLEIGPFEEDQQLIISCWGKGADMGGSVSLRNSKDVINISISGQDSVWQFFESVGTLSYTAGETVTLEFSAGGIASGIIYVDMLEVRKVE